MTKIDESVYSSSQIPIPSNLNNGISNINTQSNELSNSPSFDIDEERIYGLGSRTGGNGDKRVLYFGISSLIVYELAAILLCFSYETYVLLFFLVSCPIPPMIWIFLFYGLENRKDAYLSTLLESFYIGIGATLWLTAIDATIIFLDVIIISILFLWVKNEIFISWLLSITIYSIIFPMMMVLTISFCSYIRLTGKSILNRYSALLFGISVSLGSSFIYSVGALLYMQYSFNDHLNDNDYQSLSDYSII